ncbi:hypothetical protein AB6A40_000062 [Gnathostoma spinigerum]|uniref:G-patch domain-containing protein n=1 Tax=Gnathostoma spinigerum TaxID=75299 RepID=A0ABD6E1F7_9BILA
MTFLQESSLFYHPDTQSYYYYNAESGAMEFYAEVHQEQRWERRRVKRQAIALLGEKVVKSMCQLEIDVYETLAFILSQLSLAEDRKTIECQLDSMNTTGHLIEGESSDSEYEDERVVLIREERMDHAPCIRLLDECCSNSLFVVTITGSLVGTSCSCDIQLSAKAGECSLDDVYARISFNDIIKEYFVERLNESTTLFVNKCLVEKGDKRAVRHGDRILIGSHVLLAHLHYGTNTCAFCEPGIINNGAKSSEVTKLNLSSKQLRKRNMRLMKAKYGLYEDTCDATIRHASRLPQNQMQRESSIAETGPEIYSNCVAKPVKDANLNSVVLHQVPSQSPEISESSIGYKLLQKSGWKKGCGLGAKMDGIVQPISNVVREGRTGLGFTNQQKEVLANSDSFSKRRNLETVRKRYHALSEPHRAHLSK